MKIVAIGGGGLIGKKLVNNLRQHRHEVVAAFPSSGVNFLSNLPGTPPGEVPVGAPVELIFEQTSTGQMIPEWQVVTEPTRVLRQWGTAQRA